MSGNAPIIVTALCAPPDQAWLDEMRRTHFPPERNHLAAHITLFHHLPPSALDELDVRLKALTAAPAPAAAIVAPMSLGGGTALRIASDGLTAIRADLADAFHGMLTPQDAGGWRPHVTVQNKVSAAAARALLADLSALPWPRPIALSALAAWWYRGGPWEPIRAYPFGRGRKG